MIILTQFIASLKKEISFKVNCENTAPLCKISSKLNKKITGWRLRPPSGVLSLTLIEDCKIVTWGTSNISFSRRKMWRKCCVYISGNKDENLIEVIHIRCSPPELFLEKSVLKICSKFIGEHPCRSVILIKLLCNFIEITL